MMRWKKSFLISILGIFCCDIRGSALDERWEKAMNNALSADPRTPPNFDQGKPTMVTINMHILSLECINELEMEYCMTFFLRQRWTDPRTKYDKLPSMERLEMDYKALKSIWVPDLYFVNERRAEFHTITVPNVLMYIYPNGTIIFSMRLSMCLGCLMKLETFPFDSQYCFLRIESYGYTTRNVIFEWDKVAITTESNVYLPQFSFHTKNHESCVTKYPGNNASAFSFTCLMAEFVMDRNYGFYIAQIYVPTSLIVILSWVSFWLDIDSVPGRVSLGILTVLTMATQSSSVDSNLPHVSYVKAIDVWMDICMFFVFAAVIEFAYVNVNARVPLRQSSQFDFGLASQSAHKGSVSVANLSTANSSSQRLSQTTGEQGGRNNNADVGERRSRSIFSIVVIGREKARHLDKVSRCVFPLVFGVFNICYWSFYLTWEPNKDDFNHMHSNST